MRFGRVIGEEFHPQPDTDREAIRRGLILLLSSPSGAGKSSLTRLLLEKRELDLTPSISVTTRPRRSSEVDGSHYHFITHRQFEAMRAGDLLLEWAEVHGNLYGTPREPVEAVLAQGRDVLFDIDVQGAQKAKEKIKDDLVTIFILPPSMRELEARLIRRAEDPPEVIAKRLANARSEILRWPLYDYVVVNEDLQHSFENVLSILSAERSKAARRRRVIEQIVEDLRREV
jgi:guanylate kinase